MNETTKSIASKVINSTANVLATPAKVINGVRGAVYDYQRTSAKAASNFKGRSNNTNYYKGRGYWKDHTN